MQSTFHKLPQVKSFRKASPSLAQPEPCPPQTYQHRGRKHQNFHDIKWHSFVTHVFPKVHGVNATIPAFAWLNALASGPPPLGSQKLSSLTNRPELLVLEYPQVLLRIQSQVLATKHLGRPFMFNERRAVD